MTCEEIESAIEAVSAEITQLLAVQSETETLLTFANQLLSDLLVEYEGCSSGQRTAADRNNVSPVRFRAMLNRWRQTIDSYKPACPVDPNAK